MLPASNRSAGQSLNFPDVCKTPAPPAPFVPVPYPDMGMNMQAAPFSPFVQIGFVPATNMGSLKVMTAGDEAGSMGGLVTGIIKGPGKTTVGNPLVLVSGLPAESLANPTSGNNMNAPVGAQIVPSVVNVLYTLKREAAAPALDAAALRELADVARGDDACSSIDAGWIAPGVAYVRARRVSSHLDSEVWSALERLGRDAITRLVLDLRGNPGGDARTALRLAAAFLPGGTTVMIERDVEGDEERIVARGEPTFPWPLTIWIDGGTASAAELLAASLQFHGRAEILGTASFGKGTAQRALPGADGALRLTTVAEYRLPDGVPIDGRGVRPDVEELCPCLRP